MIIFNNLSMLVVNADGQSRWLSMINADEHDKWSMLMNNVDGKCLRPMSIDNVEIVDAYSS